MALDEPRETDHIYNIGDFQYLVDKNFMQQANPIMVDFMYTGFKITSGLVLNAVNGCSGCGSSSSCCT